MIKRFHIIIIVLLSLFGLSCLVNGPGKKQPTAINGVLDLSQWDIDHDGPVMLNGQWEFYWKQLLNPEDFSGNIPVMTGFYYVPETWNQYRLHDMNLPGEGYATYRLVIKTGYDGYMAISKLHPNTSFRLWINGEVFSEAGIVGTDPENAQPGQVTSYVVFKGNRQQVEIVMQVANYSYNSGGIWDIIHFGNKDDIRTLQENNIAFDMLLFGGLILIGLYYLGLFLVRRVDRSFLWFGIFSCLLALRALVTNQVYILNIIPHINWELMVKLNFLTFIIGVPVFLEFISCLYSDFVYRIINRVVYIFAVVFAFTVLIFPARVYSQILFLFHLNIFIMGIYIFAILIRGAINKSEGALIALAGFIVIFAVAINDILLSIYIISSIQLAPVGIIIFIFAQSFNLSRKFASAFNKAEELSENLERKVQERTNELVKERNLLRERNEIIEKELSLARRIQQQLIPATNPRDYIHSLYMPMEKVGGDFYDFINFEDSDQIGIFLSDVSGHGVPAAFITSMVKTIVLQSGFRRMDPAHLLMYLNELLHNQTGGNFITAFYGIFDPGSRKLVFANAGHNPPFIVSEKISEISGSRSVPLAVMSNNHLESLNKLYSNNEIILDPGSKLLLYTDGFTEATSIHDKEIYFVEHLNSRILNDLKHLKSVEFIRNLFLKLVQFRGSDHFDDDVCLICVDIL